MTRNGDDIFSALFLEAKDMPSQMTLYGDRRIGFSEPGDQAFNNHGGLKAGMTKWDGLKENTLLLLVDIRWLFPDAQSATAYHLATLQAKSEGKPESQAAQKIGDNCHIYSFPSGQELAVAQGIFAGAFGGDDQMARGIGRVIAGMPDDAFIYLFTRGRVAVKYFAVLGSSRTAIEARKSAVHIVAERIVSKIDEAFPNDASNKPVAWWKKLFSV
jgi:hypothetical protein